MIIKEEKLYIISSVTEKDVYYLLRNNKDKDVKIYKLNNIWMLSDIITDKERVFINKYLSKKENTKLYNKNNKKNCVVL